MAFMPQAAVDSFHLLRQAITDVVDSGRQTLGGFCSSLSPPTARPPTTHRQPSMTSRAKRIKSAWESARAAISRILPSRLGLWAQKTKKRFGSLAAPDEERSGSGRVRWRVAAQLEGGDWEARRATAGAQEPRCTRVYAHSMHKGYLLLPAHVLGKSSCGWLVSVFSSCLCPHLPFALALFSVAPPPSSPVLHPPPPHLLSTHSKTHTGTMNVTVMTVDLSAPDHECWANAR